MPGPRVEPEGNSTRLLIEALNTLNTLNWLFDSQGRGQGGRVVTRECAHTSQTSVAVAAEREGCGSECWVLTGMMGVFAFAVRFQYGFMAVLQVVVYDGSCQDHKDDLVFACMYNSCCCCY